MGDEPRQQSDIDILRNALEQAWSAETSTYDEDWSPDNPAYGQCAATACVVQDYLGGEIRNAYVDEPMEDDPVSHYFNDVDGVTVDFTLQQFSDDALIPMGQRKPKEFESTREYVLSYPETEERYELLSERVEDYIVGEWMEDALDG